MLNTSTYEMASKSQAEPKVIFKILYMALHNPSNFCSSPTNFQPIIQFRWWLVYWSAVLENQPPNIGSLEGLDCGALQNSGFRSFRNSRRRRRHRSFRKARGSNIDRHSRWQKIRLFCSLRLWRKFHFTVISEASTLTKQNENFMTAKKGQFKTLSKRDHSSAIADHVKTIGHNIKWDTWLDTWCSIKSFSKNLNGMLWKCLFTSIWNVKFIKCMFAEVDQEFT